MNISEHPEGCHCQPCKYEAARQLQEIEKSVASLGPGELSYIPKLENFPYLTQVELERWKSNSSELSAFLQLFGIELVPVGPMWKLCMLDERIDRRSDLH